MTGSSRRGPSLPLAAKINWGCDQPADGLTRPCQEWLIKMSHRHRRSRHARSRSVGAQTDDDGGLQTGPIDDQLLRPPPPALPHTRSRSWAHSSSNTLQLPLPFPSLIRQSSSPCSAADERLSPGSAPPFLQAAASSCSDSASPPPPASAFTFRRRSHGGSRRDSRRGSECDSTTPRFTPHHSGVRQWASPLALHSVSLGPGQGGVRLQLPLRPSPRVESAQDTPLSRGDRASAVSQVPSSMEQWDGGPPSLSRLRTPVAPGSRPLRIVLDDDSEAGNDHRGDVAHGFGSVGSTPAARQTRRKRQQQQRHAQSSLADQIRLQAHAPQRQEPQGEVELESETTPLAAAFRINIPSATATADGTAPNADSSAADETDSDGSNAGTAATSKRWYRKKRVMLPLLCIGAVIVSVLIALIILYPSAPSINTTSVRLSDLEWRVEDSGALTANLTLSVSINLRNGNRFGSSFDATQIQTFVALPDGERQPVAQLILPAGYVGPKAELSLSLNTPIRNTRLSNSAQLLQLMQRMLVSSESDTHGRIHFLGLRIPYTVRTRCSATCSINLMSLAVTILEQACDSSAK